MSVVKPWLSIVLLLPVLEGCFATNYVYTIGGRETYGEMAPVGGGKELVLELDDAPLEVRAGHLSAGWAPSA